MSVRPRPEGYHSITPYLIVKGASKAIEYYKTVFDAVELLRLEGPDGTIVHAEFRIDDSPIMIADEQPDFLARDPHSYGGTPVSLMLYVDDVDTVFHRAISAGGIVRRPLQDQFYGDRSGTFIDPFGHLWTVATHVEDVPEDEIKRRMNAMSA